MILLTVSSFINRSRKKVRYKLFINIILIKRNQIKNIMNLLPSFRALKINNIRF